LPGDKLSRRVVTDSNGCWNWAGALDPAGYGRVNATHNGKKYRMAHRFSLAIYKGDPGPLDVDHLCGNKRCVNPDHLEAVDPKINRGRYVHWNSKKTHCKQGHKLPDVPVKKRRVCRECRPKKRRSADDTGR
jgi:hypothetical protein